MSLSSNSILQVNVTIISGLIILLTLQSITSPVWQKQIDDYVTDTRNISIEIITVQNLMEKYCNFNDTLPEVSGKTSQYNQKCIDWQIQEDELNNRAQAWTNSTRSMQITTRVNDFAPSSTAVVAVNGIYKINVVNVIMILPFALSSIIELMYKIKNSGDEKNASRLSVILTIIGFGIIIAGFVYILNILQCASPSGYHDLCSLI